MQEVKTANEKIAELQNALGEKERYLKLVLENPDKAAFDLLRRRDSTSQPTEQALEEMQNQYGAFLAKFPTSPLTVEVVKMNGEIDRLIKNAVRTKESRARFDKVATLKLIDVTAFPQKYIGVTFRVKGNISRTMGYAAEHPHRVSENGVGVTVTVEHTTARVLAGHLEGKPGGITGEFSIKVGRDDRTKNVKFFLQDAWVN